MRVTCSLDPTLRSTCATVAGHMDPDGAARVRDELVAHIGPQTPSLLLDLRAVEWMSSAGVGTLMHLFARVQAHAGRMALWGCVPRVRAILRVCGLESPLNVCETEDEARQRLVLPQ